MTYKQLLKKLSKMKSEDLDLDVSVEVDGEIYMVDSMVRHHDDVLDDNHPVLRVFTYQG